MGMRWLGQTWEGEATMAGNGALASATVWLLCSELCPQMSMPSYVTTPEDRDSWTPGEARVLSEPNSHIPQLGSHWNSASVPPPHCIQRDQLASKTNVMLGKASKSGQPRVDKCLSHSLARGHHTGFWSFLSLGTPRRMTLILHST